MKKLADLLQVRGGGGRYERSGREGRESGRRNERREGGEERERGRW